MQLSSILLQGYILPYVDVLGHPINKAAKSPLPPPLCIDMCKTLRELHVIVFFGLSPLLFVYQDSAILLQKSKLHNFLTLCSTQYPIVIYVPIYNVIMM